MRTLITLVAVFAVLSFTTGSALADQHNKKELVGWIADAACANKGNAASEGHAGCAKKCVDGGEPIVFVDDSDKKVYKVDNQDAVKDHVGHKVTIAGTVDGDSINVDSVKM